MRAPFLRRFLKFGFQVLYYEGAWTYDLVSAAVSLGRWNDWIRSIIPFLEGPRILELGHGPGHLQAALLPRSGLQVTGLDLSPYMGRQARSRLRRKRLDPALVNASAGRLPFPPAAFETVTATFPTEYFIAPATLSEIYRVLRPGGRYVAAPAAWITGLGIPDRAAAWLFNVTGQAPDWPEQALTPFEQAGFRVRLEFIELRQSKVLIVLAER
jgi:ubiquinone/menaquinone biosynthesis C-methylase UbiE